MFGLENGPIRPAHFSPTDRGRSPAESRPENRAPGFHFLATQFSRLIQDSRTNTAEEHAELSALGEYTLLLEVLETLLDKAFETSFISWVQL